MSRRKKGAANAVESVIMQYVVLRYLDTEVTSHFRFSCKKSIGIINKCAIFLFILFNVFIYLKVSFWLYFIYTFSFIWGRTPLTKNVFTSLKVFTFRRESLYLFIYRWIGIQLYAIGFLLWFV